MPPVAVACRYSPGWACLVVPVWATPGRLKGARCARVLRMAFGPPLTRPGVPGRTRDGDQAGHTPGGTAMHGFVEVGTCRNDPCGQTAPLLEGGVCSDDCRMESTGCSVPGCGCGGRCDGVSRCSRCERDTQDIVDGRCPDCRETPVEARP